MVEFSDLDEWLSSTMGSSSTSFSCTDSLILKDNSAPVPTLIADELSEENPIVSISPVVSSDNPSSASPITEHLIPLLGTLTSFANSDSLSDVSASSFDGHYNYDGLPGSLTMELPLVPLSLNSHPMVTRLKAQLNLALKPPDFFYAFATE